MPTFKQLSASELSSGSALDELLLSKIQENMDALKDRADATDVALFKKDAVGDVVESILTEAQFQALRGTSWVLASGQNITGSKLHELRVAQSATNPHLCPDLRGVFLRGKDNGRGVADGERGLGVYQADGFGSHTHIQNAHSHSHSARVYSQSATVNHNQLITTGVISAASNYGAGIADYTGAGIHGNTATNQNTGGNETRPKNVTVNFFIKIND